MADKIVIKMFSTVFLIVFVSNVSLSAAVADAQEKCGCYSMCGKNFTTSSIHDVQKINACERGCRFFSLALHKTRDLNKDKSLENAKEGCLLSCSESYVSLVEMSACKLGCTEAQFSAKICSSVEIHTPHISYSFLIEESDILIHPGEPEPDDALTDPGLRKQIQKKLVALFDSAPKIPEIHFRNLPVKTGKLSELSHATFKCPKFYGLDSKLEFRNGKIIIGDLYLFIGVFIFVVLCFLLGNHIETKTMKRKSRESRFYEKEDFSDKELLLKMDSHEGGMIEKENFLESCQDKTDDLDHAGNLPEEFSTKFEGVSLVFHDEDIMKNKKIMPMKVTKFQEDSMGSAKDWQKLNTSPPWCNTWIESNTDPLVDFHDFAVITSAILI